MNRRRFLVGASGAMLALPFLEALAPRRAHAQAAQAPKRLVVMLTPGGRVVGRGHVVNGVRQDWWTPRTGSALLTSTGPLPAGVSPMLAALEPVKDELVTVDGVDNVMRHASPDGDGHYSAGVTALTARAPTASRAGGPSLDFVAGSRLRSGPAMRESIVFHTTVWTVNGGNPGERFYGAAGGAPYLAHNANPATAIANVFQGFQSGPPPPQPTLREKLAARRPSLLDGTVGELNRLRSGLNAADRARLDEHTERVRSLELRLAAATPPPMRASSCAKPDERSVPTYGISNYDLITKHPEYARGARDAQIAPIWIELLVQSLACDITRAAGLAFPYGDDPFFPSEPGAEPLQGGNWHTFVHGAPQVNGSGALALKAGFQFWAKMFTLLVQRLAQVQDSDGRRLLDNTLVLWTSEHGYAADHNNFNLPVVLAGLKDRFPNGQGRHVVQSQRRTTGDLYAQVLRLLGGSDQTFGETGTLGEAVTRGGRNPSSFDWHRDGDSPAVIGAATPLHTGGFDL